MEVTKAVRVALNTLVDIASHSANGELVPAPEIAKRQRISISRIELLLRPLREYGLVIAVKGRAGGYQLSKDPRIITIKDIVLAIIGKIGTAGGTGYTIEFAGEAIQQL